MHCPVLQHHSIFLSRHSSQLADGGVGGGVGTGGEGVGGVGGGVGGVGGGVGGAGPPHAAEFEQSEHWQSTGLVHVAVSTVQPEEVSPGVKQPGAGLPFQHHCLLSFCTHASHVVAGDGVGGGGVGGGAVPSAMHGQMAASYLGSLFGGVVMYDTLLTMSVTHAPL